MRTLILIEPRGQGYICTVSQDGRVGLPTGARCGLTKHAAAAHAVEMVRKFGQPNPEGWDVMAPHGIEQLVPAHLRRST